MLKRIYSQLKRLPTEFTLTSSYFALIFIGTLLLLLPISHNGELSVIDAIFTSTSAACLTGLTVLKTGIDFTFFGQIVILTLIQISGIGIMTFAVLGAELFGKRLSLKAQNVASYSIIQRDIAQTFKSIFKEIAIIVFLIEGLGVVFLFFAFYDGDFFYTLYSALFHSISAFANAGFSIYENNLMNFSGNYLVLFPIIVLIFLGGVGFPVFSEIWTKIKHKKFWSLHIKLVFLTSILLIIVGGLHFYFFEHLNWIDSLFQSVTARTAGFNSVNIGTLSVPSLLILIFLMFIGGSPASCAGGIKTTTFILWLNHLLCNVRGEKKHFIFRYFIPGEISRKIVTIVGFAFIWNFFGFFILTITENATQFDAINLFFEQISAFGTVGLSTGITEKLSTLGKLWISLTMFVGRLGHLTLILLLFNKQSFDIKYPEGKVLIG